MKELSSLILAAQAGDPEAFGRLFTQFHNQALGVAYGHLRDAYLAEDAIQEAFTEAYLNLPKLRHPEAFSQWFRLLLFKHCDRIQRGRKVSVVPLEEGIERATTWSEDDSEVKTQHALVKGYVEKMPRHQRIAAALYLAGYSPGEIAALLEVPVGTVKKRLHDARQQLRKQMGERAAEILQQLSETQDLASGFFRDGLTPTPSTDGWGLSLLATLPVGKHPGGVVLNSQTRRLYVVNMSVGEPAGSLSVFDADTCALIATLALARKPWTIALNPAANRLYLTHYFLKSLAVLDGETYAQLPPIPLAGNPIGVDVDPLANRIYVATLADGTQGGVFCGLSVFDGETQDLIAAVPIGSQVPSTLGPIWVKVDPLARLIYVSRAGSFAVIEGVHHQVVHTAELSMIYDIAINPNTHRFYLSLFSADLLLVGDGATHAIQAVIPVDAQPTSLALDPSTDRIYVAHNNKGGVSVLSGTPPQLVSVTPVTRVIPCVMGIYGGIEVDPVTHRVYVSCQDAGLLYVLQDMGAQPADGSSIG